MTVILLFIKGRGFIEKNEKTKRTIYHDLWYDTFNTAYHFDITII